jgi:putative two-component system response regulator
MGKPNILVVDDDQAVGALLAETATASGYTTVVVTDGAAALDRVRSGEFALVITDVRMPGIDGIELLRRIKAFAPEVEVVVMTALPDVERAREMIRLGASDFLTKPFRVEEVRASVTRAIAKYEAWRERWTQQRDLKAQVERQARQVREQLVTAQERSAALRDHVDTLRAAYDATIEGLMFALDSRDRASLGHSQRVAVFSEEIAKTLGVTGADLEAIRHGAMLHDIGNIGVPDAVLQKAGRLTDDEWKTVRKHAEQGYRIVQSILRRAADIVRQHHERYDGPVPRVGKTRSPGRVDFVVADTMDAMMSQRRTAACRRITRCVRKSPVAGAQFRPLVVEAFMRIPETVDRTAARRRAGDAPVEGRGGILRVRLDQDVPRRANKTASTSSRNACHRSGGTPRNVSTTFGSNCVPAQR